MISQHQVDEEFDHFDNETVNAFQSSSNPATHATVEVCGKRIRMELDTGSTHTVVSDKVWNEIGAPVLETALKFTAYGLFQLPIKGAADVFVRFQEE